MRATSLLVICVVVGACGSDDGGTADGGLHDSNGGGDGNGSGIDAREVAMVELTFGGACTPSFAGPLVVAANAESVAITSTGIVFESIQFDLKMTSGTIALSTAERIANGTVINLIQQTTWTNISSDQVDPIAGTIAVNDYQEQAGIVDLVLTGVVLQDPGDLSLCMIDGTVVSTGTSF